MDIIETRIKDVMANVLEIDVDSINEDSSQDTVEQWDSLKQLDLIVALEEEFGITVPIEEVGNMVNLKYIKLVIEEQLA